MESLNSYYSDTGNERVGFILSNGEIIEVENIAKDPLMNFEVSQLDNFNKIEGEVVASWHTHPNSTGNLSMPDYYFFIDYPELYHYIVGKDGIWKYKVEGETVYNEDYLPRSTQ